MKLNKTTRGTGIPAERLAAGNGAIADRTSKLNELYRSVLANMLWEDTYYENGESVAQRIAKLVPEVNPVKVAELAVETRNEAKLRHVPLLLVREMARYKTHAPYVADTLYNVIQRADELTEFVSIYWVGGKQPLSAQVKKGLARAFTKFDEYALSKYSRDSQVKLRDVLFLCHARPQNKAQEDLWKRLINDDLKIPDTWEVAISSVGNGDKKDAWERLLKENKLGSMALLRNLRNFEQAGVDREFIKEALKRCKTERVLPFRFISAVNHAPQWQVELENLMLKSMSGQTLIKGRTVICVDCSGSMRAPISSKSEMTRLDCAAALCIILREVCEDVVFYATAGNDSTCIHQTIRVKPNRGFALKDEIVSKFNTLGGGGIFLSQVMDFMKNAEKGKANQVIVITDEQDTDKKINPQNADNWGKYNFIVNISAEKNGIAYSKFHHINGFSEKIIDYIGAFLDLEERINFNSYSRQD